MKMSNNFLTKIKLSWNRHEIVVFSKNSHFQMGLLRILRYMAATIELLDFMMSWPKNENECNQIPWYGELDSSTLFSSVSKMELHDDTSILFTGSL